MKDATYPTIRIAQAAAASALAQQVRPGPRKGRGSVQAMGHRFSGDVREPFDDGWGGVASPDSETDGTAAAQSVPTQWSWEEAHSAIQYNRSEDLRFDRSINPYRGCEHGCSYCYARPSHAYLGMSPGLDFETRLIAKRSLDQVLLRELSRPKYQPDVLALGAVTDAYQPIERDLGVTRSVLQILHDCRHPVALVTKGSLVERDVDLLAPMARQHLAGVYITLTTLNPEWARKLEPRAPAPWRRLKTIQTLVQAGIPVGVSLAPQIPFINEDMEQVLSAAAEMGATRAFYAVLRLPWELSPLFRAWLQEHAPQRAARVMTAVQSLHGGQDYQARYGWRMRGQGAWAEMLAQRFAVATRRLGLNQQPATAWNRLSFRPPHWKGQGTLNF